jgi:hypothetical protein
MAGTLSPVGKQYFTDDEGVPLSGGLLYTYEAGTVTPATTWSNADLSSANANPIVLDVAGRCTIYLGASNYKYVLKDALESLIWTQDNISSVASQGTLGEVFSFGGTPSVPVNVTSYPTGTAYAALASGTTILQVESSTLGGTYALAGMLVAPAGQTITAAIMNLSDGAPDTPLATISTNDTTGVLVKSGAITFAAAGAEKSYGIKIIVSGGTGFAWGFSLLRIT